MPFLSSRAICSPLLTLFSLALTTGLLRGADPLVTAENTVYELCVSCSTPQVRVLVNAKGNIIVSEQPEVVQVLSAGQRDDGLQRAFTASWEANAKGIPRAINIKLSDEFQKKEALLAGSYDLYLDLQPESHADAPRLKVTLSRPVPKLSVYPKVIISRTRWLPFFDRTSWDEKSPQILDEISQKSGADNLRVRLVTPVASGTQIGIGSLAFPNLPSKLAAGDHIDNLEYEVSGPFPLGTTTGTMKVYATGSPDALASFDFEVHDKVARGYLWLILALGLATSWAVKVKLQQNIEWDQAYLDAEALVKRVEAEAAKHENKNFQSAYESSLKALKTAMAGESASEINSKKLDLDKLWKEALEQLTKDRQPEVEAYEQLEETLRFVERLELPSDLLKAASEARAALLASREMLDRDAFDQVKAARESAIERVARSILDFAEAWKPKLRQSIETLMETNGLSAPLAKQAAEQAVGVRAALDKVNESGVITSADQLKQAAGDLNNARSVAEQYFSDVAANNEIDLVNAKGQIRRANVAAWKPEPFEEVELRSAELSEDLVQLLDMPDASVAAQALDALHTAWSDALQQQLSQTPAELEALLDGSKYLEALAFTLRTLRQQSAPKALEGSVQKTSKSALGEPDEGTAVPVFSWHRLIPQSELTMLRIGTGITPDRPPVFPTRVEHRLWLSKLWQTLGTGVLAVIGGYGLFSAAWIGSFADFSTAFFWAFGLDLTVDAVLKAVKK